MGATKEAVVFLLPDGSEVSNDPRYYEGKMRQQIIDQNTKRAMAAASENTGSAGSDDDDDVDMEEGDGLDEMTGDQLKDEVSRMKDEDGIEVDTSGVKKKSELVERIRAARAENA